MFVLRAAFPDKTGQIQAICRETASIASARSWLSLEAETAASASAFSAASIALSSDSDIFGMGFSIHRRVSKGARKSGPPDLRTVDADLGQARDRCAVPTRRTFTWARRNWCSALYERTGRLCPPYVFGFESKDRSACSRAAH